ncbi:hypothetical protein [Microbulbifer agarilyticus]|uniref:hypothetical protein n=1 Tax=Microbulbifer agarilyticus TaxID=260552 RepID=UPI001CD32A56|nr:hypothetical protein [Microbulbifer agarilyticus]MCA0893859.1 hypothetical protein [Microbulbifer agarilyticus]
MELTSLTTTNMSDYSPQSTGKIYSLAINISNIKQRVEEMTQVVTDTSWLDPLDVIDKATYSARSEPTINKVVNDILNQVESDISVDFGEYMVSDSAQSALATHLDHLRIPLAELIKEKITGNPGFDFHTECPSSFVTFGEAKYSGVQNAHGRALSQINDFIVAQKDIQELSDLRKFVSETAIQNAASGRKSFCAAFSIISDDVLSIMDNALTSSHMAPLLSYEAVYLIGVKVSA